MCVGDSVCTSMMFHSRAGRALKRFWPRVVPWRCQLPCSVLCVPLGSECYTQAPKVENGGEGGTLGAPAPHVSSGSRGARTAGAGPPPPAQPWPGSQQSQGSPGGSQLREALASLSYLSRRCVTAAHRQGGLNGTGGHSTTERSCPRWWTRPGAGGTLSAGGVGWGGCGQIVTRWLWCH